MKSKIDRSSPISLQKQLYMALKDWFVSDFQPEDLLPAEVAISKEFGVSQGTVRIVMDNLVKEELIIRSPGRGSFLSPDFKIKLKKYSIGVVLSEVDFFSNTIWEYVRSNHLEIVNGLVGANIPYNLSTEFISEDYFCDEDNENYDGFILWPFLQNDLPQKIRKPYVNLEYKVDLPGGFKRIAADAAKRDFNKVGYIGFTSGGRIEVINDVFRKAGMPPIPEERIFECGGSETEAYRSCMVLIRRYPDVDCLICSTDMRAKGVLQCLRERNVSVPEQVSVYGFDGTRDNRRVSPLLTTCRFNWKEPGRFAVEQIRSLLDGRALCESSPMRGTLVLQDSTRR